jgi:hypothetical protein
MKALLFVVVPVQALVKASFNNTQGVGRLIGISSVFSLTGERV